MVSGKIGSTLMFGVVLLLAALASIGSGSVVLAASGDLLDTVPLTGNSSCNVGIAFDGTYVMAIDNGSCGGTEIGIHTPGTGALVATKTVKDAGGALVTVSTIDWDSRRSKLWGAYQNDVYLIDIGNPAVTGDALATFQFNPNVGGNGLIDGLAWDSNDDTLYHSPDVDCNVFQFSPAGVLLNTVTPKNAAGVSDCDVSGVAIGSANSLYIGRNGNAEIRRVNKTNGNFISTFATTAGRVEDLVCDPVTYAPLEAILAKDAFSSLYEAFEVEAGTCPLPVPELVLDPADDTNEAGDEHTVTATISLAGSPIGAGVLVSFEVSAGPNVGEVSDPNTGECTANDDCTTGANGQVSWTYTGSLAVGDDTIQACFTDERGVEHCDDAVKHWVDTTAPVASCEPTTNPAGKNEPTAPGKGNQGQNQDGFYIVSAEDTVDPDPTVHVVDRGPDDVYPSADDYEFAGPFPSPTKIKYTEANGAAPSQKPGAGVITWQLKGRGDAVVYAVDAAGNVSAPVLCKVPPPPK